MKSLIIADWKQASHNNDGVWTQWDGMQKERICYVSDNLITKYHTSCMRCFVIQRYVVLFIILTRKNRSYKDIYFLILLKKIMKSQVKFGVWNISTKRWTYFNHFCLQNLLQMMLLNQSKRHTVKWCLICKSNIGCRRVLLRR